MFFRQYCKNIPDILPKILLAVKWNSRDEVAQVDDKLYSHYPELVKEILVKILVVSSMHVRYLQIMQAYSATSGQRV